MEKTINVLVVDDIEQNLESAKKYFENTDRILQGIREEKLYDDETQKGYNIPQEFLEKGINLVIKSDYATNAFDAIEIIKNKKIDYVLSDVFFDYNKNGTPNFVKEKITDELGPWGVLNSDNLSEIYKERFEKENWIKEHELWRKGNSTPPVGVYLYDYMNENKLKVAIGFNTSQGHHSILGEPVSQWAHSQAIPYFDWLSYRNSPKQWDGLLEEIIVFGEHQVKQRKKE